MGGERIERSHKIVADEPYELLGRDSAPNPQELLMSAFNACMMVGYVARPRCAGSSSTVEIKTRGSSTCAASSASMSGGARLRADRL
jgi:uncharacterized OsmC-like protein